MRTVELLHVRTLSQREIVRVRVSVCHMGLSPVDPVTEQARPPRRASRPGFGTGFGAGVRAPFGRYPNRVIITFASNCLLFFRFFSATPHGFTGCAGEYAHPGEDTEIVQQSMPCLALRL